MQAPQDVQFDVYNPYPWYCMMRSTSPLFYDEQMKMWLVLSYQNVQQVLLDTAHFSSQRPGIGVIGSSFVAMDPPRHRQLRSLVNQAFTPRTVALLESRIRTLVCRLLDRVGGTGQMEVLADLANPLPTIVIAELLGVPSTNVEQFKEWTHRIINEAVNVLAGKQAPGQGRMAQEELMAYFLEMIEERRRFPKDDLISLLLAAEIDGERLSTSDIQVTSILLLLAGNETTTYLISNALLCLTEYPETLKALEIDSTLIPMALEEVLRYRPPIKAITRIAAVDTHFSGADIKAGDLVRPVVASANRDEAIFTDPELFQIQRTPNRHLSFGHGIHFCLGAPLARLESKVALEVMLQQLTRIERDPDRPLDLVTGKEVSMSAIASLPLIFSQRT
jgi:cytochrome P450